MKYELTLPQTVVFGPGRLGEIGSLSAKLGRDAIFVCGSRTLEKSGVVQKIRESLHADGVRIVDTLMISREPTVQDVDEAVGRCRTGMGKTASFLLAFGGGAALDLAKAVAGMIPQQRFETVRDYLEGVGRGWTMEADPLPILAVPTTSGTGSEATKNAVIASYDPPYKKSLRDPGLVPKTVLIDPELTLSCPAKITAASGMDAITQLFESYVSTHTQPFTRALCEQGLVLAWNSIVEAIETPNSITARENMAHAAFLSGICLANAGLGMAHGIAPALGTIGRVSHGAACAFLLPLTLRTNAETCQTEYARLARLLLGTKIDNETDESIVSRLIEQVEKLCDKIGATRRLSDFGVTRAMIPEIAANSLGSSMVNNPVPLTAQDVAELLESAF